MRRALALLALPVMAALLLACPDGAEGATRGFEPSAATLACIRAGEGSPQYDQRGRTYQGAYQMDRRFALTYSAAIGPEHWALWGSDREAPTWTWHPMIQDEVARNGVRARGLQPWPPARRRCARS